MAHDKHMNGDCAMPEHLRGVHHDVGPQASAAVTFQGEDIQTLCEWFGVVMDMNPDYLERKDFTLAYRLYVAAGRRVPNEIRTKIGLGPNLPTSTPET
jgi:hypothetical protein